MRSLSLSLFVDIAASRPYTLPFPCISVSICIGPLAGPPYDLYDRRRRSLRSTGFTNPTFCISSPALATKHWPSTRVLLLVLFVHCVADMASHFSKFFLLFRGSLPCNILYAAFFSSFIVPFSFFRSAVSSLLPRMLLIHLTFPFVCGFSILFVVALWFLLVACFFLSCVIILFLSYLNKACMGLVYKLLINELQL